MRISATILCTLATLAIVPGIAAVSASARPAARAGSTCHAPRLTGLTLEVARARAEHAGCTLRLKGAALERASVQTVARQTPARGRAARVTVWLNPFCAGSAAYGPSLAPAATRGPTELISGFYLDGGPLRRFSSPGCNRAPAAPGAGIVEVLNASGALIATQRSASGHHIEIPLPPGSYTIIGTFLNATINGVNPKQTKSLVIPPGDTVHQAFSLSIP